MPTPFGSASKWRQDMYSARRSGTGDEAETPPPDTNARSNAQLRAIVDAIPGFVFRRVLARDGTVTFPYISSLMRRHYGIGPMRESAPRKPFDAYLHRDDRKLFQDAMAVWAEHLSSLEVAVRLGNRSENPSWLRIVSYPRRLQSGDTLWDCIALDITQAKALEKH